MVVETAAIVAVLLAEPEAEAIAKALGEASPRLISAVTRVELSLLSRDGREGLDGSTWSVCWGAGVSKLFQ